MHIHFSFACLAEDTNKITFFQVVFSVCLCSDSIMYAVIIHAQYIYFQIKYFIRNKRTELRAR